MRMLLKVKIPHEEFNQAVRDGTVGLKVRRILEDIKPEAIESVTFEDAYSAKGGTISKVASFLKRSSLACRSSHNS